MIFTSITPTQFFLHKFVVTKMLKMCDKYVTFYTIQVADEKPKAPTSKHVSFSGVVAKTESQNQNLVHPPD
jgi:hypothetical protein